MRPDSILQVIRVHFCFALLAVVFGSTGALGVGTGTDESSLATGGFTEIFNFEVSLDDHGIGVVTEYRLDFSMVSTRFSHLPGGGFVITFPRGFLLDSASLIDFSHSEYRRTFVVESLERSDRSLTVNLTSLRTSLGVSTEETDYIDTVDFSIVFGDIGNPVTAGQRGLGLVVFDRSDRIMAPIAYSNLFDIEGVETKGIQLAEVSVIAPNQPNVNTGQPFQIRCLLVNPGEYYSSPFRISMVSDGNSQFASDLPVESIPSGDSTEVFFDVTASPVPSSVEVFVVGLHSGDVVWEPPLDDNAAVVIQTPASLLLNRTPEKDTIYVTHASSLALGLSLINEGQAEAGAGLFRLTGGSLFGLFDPLIDTIKAGEPYILVLHAPVFNTVGVLSFSFDELPVDLNDSLPVAPNITSFETVVIVTDPSAALIANSEPITSGPVLLGTVTDLFRLRLTNAGLPPDPDIRVDSIKLIFAAANGNVFPAEPLIDPDRSGLYEDDQLVSAAYVHEDQLVFTLDNFSLTAGGSTRTLTLKLTMNYGVAESFAVRLSAAGISAVYASGPQTGQPVGITTGDTDGLVFSGVFTPVTGLSLDDSFMIKDNPFDPLVEAAELQFYLPEPSDVVFRVLTLTGEEVYAREYSECELVPGALNTVRWDGRNDEGYTVLNGVYVTMLRIERSGEEGFLKLALVKR